MALTERSHESDDNDEEDKEEKNTMQSIDMDGLEGDDDEMFGGLLEDAEKPEAEPVEQEKLARAG